MGAPPSWPCLPQDEKTPDGKTVLVPKTPCEQAEFRISLPNINLLYLGGSVLALVDLSYMSRFWARHGVAQPDRRADTARASPRP